MTSLEKSFESILSNLELDIKHELLVLYKSELFFISIERLLFSLTLLPMEQQNKVLTNIQKYRENKTLFINLLHDLSKPILSIHR
jgi:hypothetical protein